MLLLRGPTEMQKEEQLLLEHNLDEAIQAIEVLEELGLE